MEEQHAFGTANSKLSIVFLTNFMIRNPVRCWAELEVSIIQDIDLIPLEHELRALRNHSVM